MGLRPGRRHIVGGPRRPGARVEQLIPLAERSGIKLTHLAMAFAVSHPGVTSAIIGPRTIEHLDDLLAGAGTTLDDALLDEIDAIVAPGTDVSRLDMAYKPPALQQVGLRRRTLEERPAAFLGIDPQRC